MPRHTTAIRSFSAGPDDDAGELAVLLCDSIFHVLVEQKLIPKEVAVAAVEGVAELAREIAMTGEHPVAGHSAVGVTETMAHSLALKD
jgi:hypothetical protein